MAVLFAAAQTPRIASPDEAVSTFVSAVRAERWEEAASVVEGVAVPPGEDQIERLRQLGEVLRILGIRSGSPTFGDATTRAVFSRVRNEIGELVGAVALVERDGRWQFERETWDGAETLFGFLATAPEVGVAPDAAKNPPAGLTNPREAIGGFLLAMNADDVEAAARALDLTGLNPVLRETEGERLARLLFAILNRTDYVDLEAIPDAPDAQAYVLRAFVEPRSGNLTGRVVLARQSDGGWRFSAETVQQLPRIWDSVQENPVLRGLKDVSPESLDPATWLRRQFPKDLHREGFGLQIWQWISLAGLLVGGWLVALMLWWTIKLAVRRHVPKDHVSARTRLRWAGISLVSTLVAALVGYGLPYLGLPAPLLIALIFSVRLAGIIGVSILLVTVWEILLTIWVRRSPWANDRSERLVVPVLSRLGRAFMVLGAIIAVIALAGVNVAGLIAGLGIGGLVIALAAKDSVENLFGSVTVLVENPFQIGDFVRVNGIEGEVEQINLRSTKIRTAEDSVVTLPNSQLITAAVENLGRRRYRRARLMLKVHFATPPETIHEFCEQIRASLAAHPSVVSDKSYVYLNDFGDTTLNVLVQFFIVAANWNDELATRDEVMRKIMDLAGDLGVQFAVPMPVALATPDTIGQPPGAKS
jgi:MscS family membrane protein